MPPTADTESARMEVTKDALYKYAAPANEQLIGQLISQLDQDQALLVKLHLPPVGVQRSLDELQRSYRVQVLATDGSVMALLEGEASPQAGRQFDDAADKQSSAATVELPLGTQLVRGDPNVLVVNGSADQIRATLANLAAQPDVAIEPVPAELDAVRTRWLMQSSENKEASTPPVDAPRQPAGEKTEEAAQPAQTGDSAALARRSKGQPLPLLPQESQGELAKAKRMIYVYFRLQPDTLPSAPAAKPDQR